MTDNKKQDKAQQVIADFIKEENPNSALEHAEAFGYLKGYLGDKITQPTYCTAVGIGSSRTLRVYIKDNRESYEQQLALGQEQAEPEIDMSTLNTRTMSEEQIDRFIQVLYESAITGNARDRQLLIDFTGMTAADVMSLQQSKASTLRWWIKGNLSKLQKAVDSKDLGVHLSETELLYKGDKESRENAQNFINKSVTDNSFKQELLYWGMVFMQMYNNVQHPDYETLSTALRVQRLEQGTAKPINKQLVRRYAAGNDMSADKKAVSKAELEATLLEIFDKEKVEGMLNNYADFTQTVQAPEVNEIEVQQRAAELQDELEVMLTTEEEMRKLFNKKLKRNK